MSPVVAIIEARMTSSRLPGKVLLPAGGKPLLQILVERLKHTSSLDQVVVATTHNASDDPIVSLCEEIGAGVFRGSEEDVLARVCGAARAFGAETLVEVTADCPLTDPLQVEEALALFNQNFPASRYVSNCPPLGNAPVGMNVQVFKSADLFEILSGDPDPLDREHVSYRFSQPAHRHKYSPLFVRLAPPLARPDIWVTLDYHEDYELIRALIEDLSRQNPMFGLADVIGWIDAHPDLHNRCLALRSPEELAIGQPEADETRSSL